MKSFRNALLLSAAMFGAHAACATTLTLQLHGNSCTSITPGNAPVYTQFGPYNQSTTSALDMTCPVTFASRSYTAGYILVTGWNRSTTDNLFCNYASTDAYGNNRALVQAVVPYANGGSGLGQANLSMSNTGLPYVTCHLPAATANGKSYLSGIYLEATY